MTETVTEPTLPDMPEPQELVPAAQDPRIPPVNDFDVHFGIPISSIGEDGDMLALGHHEPKVALAAFNAYAKKLGFLDLLDGGKHDQQAWKDALDAVDRRWAVLLTDLCRACMKEPLARADCPDCQAVREITKDGAWWIAYDATEDEPGAFPVTSWTV